MLRGRCDLTGDWRGVRVVRVGVARDGRAGGIRLVYVRRREEPFRVSVAPNAHWSQGRPGTELDQHEAATESRLELLDRVIGLEQQLSELQSANLLSPSETVAVEQRLASMQSSAAWRVGRIVTLPLRAMRVVARRLRFPK